MTIHSAHTPTRTSLRLPRPLRVQLESWAVDGYPHEACGLLLGRRDGPVVTVDVVRRARNLVTARARDRYELDPLDQLAAEDEARRLGLDVVGIWHSHPDHPARPSETDRAQAWSGWSYVIVSVAAGRARDLRSWRLVEDEGDGDRNDDRDRDVDTFDEEEVLP